MQLGDIIASRPPSRETGHLKRTGNKPWGTKMYFTSPCPLVNWFSLEPTNFGAIHVKITRTLATAQMTRTRTSQQRRRRMCLKNCRSVQSDGAKAKPSTTHANINKENHAGQRAGSSAERISSRRNKAKQEQYNERAREQEKARKYPLDGRQPMKAPLMGKGGANQHQTRPGTHLDNSGSTGG